MPRLPHLPATPKPPEPPEPPEPHPALSPAALIRAAREWAGWFVVAAGAVLCVLGWYGVSGESVIEQQLPYLASATIPGAALIVAGAMLIASRPPHRTEQADRRIETLYTLLVADPTETDPSPTHSHPDDPQALLAVPGGTLYHRRDCPLVADKPTAEPIDAATAAERGLTPCPVCEPPAPPSAGARPTPDEPTRLDGTTSRPASDQPAAADPAGVRPDADPNPNPPTRPAP